MKKQKCMDCKYHVTLYNPLIKRLGKPIHGICLKYNESLTFLEACDEFEIKEKENTTEKEN